VEYAGRSVLKLSAGKESWPGRKQVFRLCDAQGKFAADVIALRHEQIAGAKPLLMEALKGGKIAARLATLEESREVCRDELSRLPELYKTIVEPAGYPVEFSSGLRALREATQKRVPG
jgi:nicotinate phosphoribosyltransferase